MPLREQGEHQPAQRGEGRLLRAALPEAGLPLPAPRPLTVRRPLTAAPLLIHHGRRPGGADARLRSRTGRDIGRRPGAAGRSGHDDQGGSDQLPHFGGVLPARDAGRPGGGTARGPGEACARGSWSGPGPSGPDAAGAARTGAARGARGTDRDRHAITFFTKKISGVGQRYDLPGDHPPTGRSAPDLELSDGTRPAVHLHDGRGLLLDLAYDAGVRACAAEYGDRVRVRTTGCPGRPGPAGLLVRPDGCTARAADSGDQDTRDELAAALRSWCGTPDGVAA